MLIMQTMKVSEGSCLRDLFSAEVALFSINESLPQGDYDLFEPWSLSLGAIANV